MRITSTQAIIVLAIITPIAACSSEPRRCVNDDQDWTSYYKRTEPVIDVLLVKVSGALTWNGRPTSDGEIAEVLRLRANMPSPAMLLRHEPGADCERVSVVRNIIASASKCDYGECHEGDAWNWVPSKGINAFDGGGNP